MILTINNTVSMEIDSFRECLETDTALNKPFIYLELKKSGNDKTMLQTLKPFLEDKSISSLTIFDNEQLIYDFADAYTSIARAYTLYDEELNQVVTTVVLEA